MSGESTTTAVIVPPELAQEHKADAFDHAWLSLRGPSATHPVSQSSQQMQAFLASIDQSAITIQNLATITKQAVQAAEQVPGLSGPDKKAWVQAGLRFVIRENAHLSEPERQMLLTLLDATIPQLIDSLVDMYNAGQAVVETIQAVLLDDNSSSAATAATASACVGCFAALCRKSKPLAPPAV